MSSHRLSEVSLSFRDACLPEPAARVFRRMRKLTSCFPALAYGALLPAAVVFAQSSASLSGVVVDAAGAVVPGAHIVLSDAEHGFLRDITTGREGIYAFTQLNPGTYTLRAIKPGFALLTVESLVLSVDDRKSLRLKLDVGVVGQSLTVTAGTAGLTYDPSTGSTIDHDFIENLPINGRSFQSLIELSPGVVTTSSGFGESGQISVNGQRSNANYYTVDGVSANTDVSPSPALGQSGSGSTPGFSALGTTSNLISVDALQEFKVQTSSFAPEFGRTPGAQVSIVSRGGTNSLHGTLFDYFRNDKLDANDWFSDQAGLPKAATRQNDFGGVLGGRIIRNRTFFFISYEGLRLRQPRTALESVPDTLVRKSATAALKPYLNAFPVANGPELGGGGAQFSGTYSDPSSTDSVSGRIDHRINSKFQFFARFEYAPSNTTARGNGLSTPNTVSSTSVDTTAGTTALTTVVGAHTTNDLRFNFTHSSAASNSTLDNYGGAAPLTDAEVFPTGLSSQTGFYQLSVAGYGGFALGKLAGNGQDQFNLVDSFSLVRRNHQLRFGVDYRRLASTYAPQAYSEALTFTGLTGGFGSLTSGTAAVLAVSASGEARHPIFSNYSAYAQDTWQVNPRLTLTYGLRWDINPAPVNNGGSAPLALKSLSDYSIASSGTPIYKTTWGNVAPRLGIAYQLNQASGKEMVLRVGGGIFYDLGYGSIGNTFSAAPYSNSTLTYGSPFPPAGAQIAAPKLPAAAPYAQAAAADPNLSLPRVYQWNVTLHRNLGGNQSLSLAYVGSAGRDLLRLQTLTNPAPQFQQLALTTNAAVSDYHALQLQFQRKLAHNLRGQASYTWSHSIDTASSDSAIGSTVGLLGNERGASDFDIRHNFTAAASYGIPSPKEGMLHTLFGNWWTDATARIRSATPYDVLAVSTSEPGFGPGAGGPPIGGTSTSSRPDYVYGQPLYIDDPSSPGGRRLNPKAFAFPPGNRQGTLGRNVLRGFGAGQLDLTLRRDIRLRERLNLQVRAEAFNVFNHPNFANPSVSSGATLGSQQFGQSTQMLNQSLNGLGGSGGLNSLYQMGGPRSMQLSLKLSF